MTTQKTDPTRLQKKLLTLFDDISLFPVHGRVVQVIGAIVKALVPGVKVGELCTLLNPDGSLKLQAEVVGFQEKYALLTPMGDMLGISSHTEVIPSGKKHVIAVGDHLLGQVLNGLGNPMDQEAAETGDDENHREWRPVYADPPSPMSRPTIDTVIPMGVRAIDSLLSCAEGQRLGIFAAAGCGKSTLLSMLVRSAQADVTVLALIGERGREVREFIEHDLGPEGMKKSVVVVSTSDSPAMERAKAACVATAVAEYFRDQGKRVLLLMDSVTRYARALREIGLAAGEPPTRRGYPPSVFANLPRLLERAGQSSSGSITAFYTVLVEGDDMNEPIADETRSLLDGHIILSRKMAASSHYPAIDVLRSASRVMTRIVPAEHLQAAARIRELMAKYEEVELLLQIGEYKQGADPLADEAIQRMGAINAMLRQGTHEFQAFDKTQAQLRAIAGL